MLTASAHAMERSKADSRLGEPPTRIRAIDHTGRQRCTDMPAVGDHR
jgi:hypothetical protein